MRQLGKQILTSKQLTKNAMQRLRAFGFIGAILLAAGFAQTAQAQSFKHSVSALNALAVGGYDVVSYFVRSRPLKGVPEYEHVWDGISWFFATEANRDAFIAHPEVYAPQFGGYGAMGVARGYLSAGDPQVYVLTDNQLYLFYSAGNKLAFEAAPNIARHRAIKHWDKVSPELLDN